MAASDVFVELIDLLKKPVDLAGDIIRVPIQIIDTERKVRENTGEERVKAQLELKKLKANYERQRKEARENAKLERDINKWEEDVRNLRSKNEFARYKDLVKLAEQFAEETARTFKDIQDSISTMATEQEKDIVTVQAHLIKMFNQLYQEERESVYNDMKIGLAACSEDKEIQHMMVYEPLSERLKYMAAEQNMLVKALIMSIQEIEKAHREGITISRNLAEDIFKQVTSGINPGLQIQNQENPKAIEDGSVVETTLANNGADS